MKRLRISQVTESKFSFKADDYELEFDFFGTIDSEKASWKVGARDVAFVLPRKESGDYWDKLNKGCVCVCVCVCARARTCVLVKEQIYLILLGLPLNRERWQAPRSELSSAIGTSGRMRTSSTAPAM